MTSSPIAVRSWGTCYGPPPTASRCVLSETGGCCQGLGAVRQLPGDPGKLTTEVATSNELGIDRSQQVEVRDDRTGSQVKNLTDGALDDSLRHVIGAKRVDTESYRASSTNGVGNLALATIS